MSPDIAKSPLGDSHPWVRTTLSALWYHWWGNQGKPESATEGRGQSGEPPFSIPWWGFGFKCLCSLTLTNWTYPWEDSGLQLTGYSRFHPPACTFCVLGTFSTPAWPPRAGILELGVSSQEVSDCPLRALAPGGEYWGEEIWARGNAEGRGLSPGKLCTHLHATMVHVTHAE